MIAKLLGENVANSLSPKIHKELNMKDYELLNIKKDEFKDFLLAHNFDFLNITMPYKKECIKYLDEISDLAKKTNSVNTIINKNGKLYGYNTDYYGIEYTFNSCGINVKNKKVLVLGNGGVANTVKYYLEQNGAKEVVVVSRKGDINYDNVYSLAKDTQIIINATPVGSENCKTQCLIKLEDYKRVKFVFDLVYSPLKTQLLVEAERLKIKNTNGLKMLIFQAFMGERIFFETHLNIGKDRIEKIEKKILADRQNIVLIGMSGVGKTFIGEKLAIFMNKPFFDSDKIIEEKTNKTISQIFNESGEEYFRKIERQVIVENLNQNGAIISVGGGAVLNEENVLSLKRYGEIILLVRDLKKCEIKNRPKVNSYKDLKDLYKKRKHIYNKCADIVVKNNGDYKKTIEKILRKI